MSKLSRILSKPQRIKDNLSSRQLFVVLDRFLANGLMPLAKVSPTFQEFSAEVISQAVVHRRKVEEETLQSCFMAIFDSSDVTIRAIVDSGIDRRFIFSYIRLASDLGKELLRAHVEACKASRRVKQETLHVLSRTTNLLGNNSRVISATREAAFWYEQAIDFRTQIIEKYLLLIYQRSVSENKRAFSRLEVDDLFSTGYVVAIRAVEKFNSKRGVFTSYLALWLKGVSSNASVQAIGLAFSSRAKDTAQAYSLPIEAAEDKEDTSVVSPDDSGSELIRKISALKHDLDVRSALIVSGLPPE